MSRMRVTDVFFCFLFFCFLFFFVFFSSVKKYQKPFSGTAERIFMKLYQTIAGKM